MALLASLLLSSLASFAQDKADEPNTPEKTQSLEGEEPSADEESSAGKERSAENEPSANKNAIERTVPKPHQNLIKQLKASYKANELNTLQAEGESFHALWRKDSTGQAYGAVLLVPTDGQTPNWPYTIEPLRTHLSTSGWATLSIEISPHPASAIPSRPAPKQVKAEQKPAETEADENGDKTENDSSQDEAVEKPIENQQEITTKEKNTETSIKKDSGLARIDAAIQFLHNNGQFNIVLVAYGNSAQRVLDYVFTHAKNPTKQMRALVLVNPMPHKAGDLNAALTRFNELNLPILDISFSQHPIDQLKTQERLNIAKSHNFNAYEQSLIMEPLHSTSRQENRLSKRIRGFLNRKAKGVEIER